MNTELHKKCLGAGECFLENVGFALRLIENQDHIIAKMDTCMQAQTKEMAWI